MKLHRVAFCAAFVLFVMGVARDLGTAWVSNTVLPPMVGEVSSEVVDRNGDLLRVYPVEDGIWRLATTPDQVDPGFLDMLIQVEDKRFYDHSGVDLRAMLRAAGQAVSNGRVMSGASTLTMQTARLLENSGTGGWAGKLRQIRVALAMERRLSKSEILALYLTHAPYGGPLEGVRAASYAWFGKPPLRLSPSEAALLVALPQSPTARRPDRYPEAARDSRNRVLARLGRGPSRDPVPSSMRAFPAIAPHVSDRFRMTGDRHVSLTLDRHIQTQAEALAQRAVHGLPSGVSAALVVIDHHTGNGLAYVGASFFGHQTRAGFVDMVRAKRSPGSTLKPLIYALAMDQGLIHPETIISDEPVSFSGYAPQNFDGVFRGDVTIRIALEQSLNIAPVLLTNAMGPARLMAGLRRSGVAPELQSGQPGLAVALGGVGLSLEDLAQVYTGLARGGNAVPLRWSAQSEGPSRKVVSRAAAWHISHILAGIQPPNGQARGEIASKTGTSYGHRDAWALGWDGQYVVGVWLGRPDGTPVPGIFGGDLAAPILFEMFSRLADEPSPLPMPPPETLIAQTSTLPTPLQRFDRRGRDNPMTVSITFPPAGAQLMPTGDGDILVKLIGGRPPYALLANGRPIRTGVRERTVLLPGLTAGFAQLQALDADGRSHSVSVTITQ